MSDRHVSADDVQREHMDNVDRRAHVLYMVGVLGGAALVMLALMLLLDALS
jgi:hypothetical protein